ncbi:AraC family transcriptional regulator [Siphonobacter sp. BAB-5405]|nr:AraC family transcriptional regulator [Siphonobacter sp. BAB-5405]
MKYKTLKTIKFLKTECGVDFLLRAGLGQELLEVYLTKELYNTDFFEILIFRKAQGSLLLNQKSISITDNTIVFISPFQKRQWNLDDKDLDFTFLYFQEDFLNDFFADKLFTYRLLYFYQLDRPLSLLVEPKDIDNAYRLLLEVKAELKHITADREHVIRSLLYYLLMKLNREYAQQMQLPLEKPENNYAYQFKKLLEVHIKDKQRINEYTSLLGISRITLNKAVQAQFGVTSIHLLKKRLLFEIESYLLHSSFTVAEIAHTLHFSEPQHLMRFFKTQTGMTTSEFILTYQNGSNGKNYGRKALS